MANAPVWAECYNCNQNFLNKSSFYRHRKLCLKNEGFIEKDETYKLCGCGMKFQKLSYNNHKRECVEMLKKHEEYIFKTCFCGKMFKTKTIYYDHRKMCAEAQLKLNKKEGPILKTCNCGANFKSISSYYNHKKKCGDKVQKNISQEHYKCHEEECSFTCNKHSDFLNHLKEIHSIEMYWEEKTFETREEFEDWKEDCEKSTKSSFICYSVHKGPTGLTKYFRCNRSGFYKSQATGKRTMKSQGLTKIGFLCTAKLKVQFLGNSTKVICKTCHSHYGHDNNLCYLRLSKRDRAFLANQLTLGMEHSHIQRNVFSLFTNELQRQHLIRKRDLQNISKAYGINRMEKHTEDHMSVDAYIEENLKEENSIILYKEQGNIMLQYPLHEKCRLEQEDFALGIMTDFQSQMLQEFGHNIICLDAIYETDSHDFILITVLVIDEFKEGIPVAWLICNKETHIALKLFFELIKKKVGDVSPQVIMSNKAPQYFNAWTEVFECKPKKLLSHSHVRYDWQKQLNKILNKNTASSLYKDLCVLLEEPDVEKFYDLLEKFKMYIYEHDNTKEFAEYFEDEWIGIEKEWSCCHRIGLGISTNIYLESFYNALKYEESYSKAKHERHINNFVDILLQFEKDVAAKRLMKLEKTTDINKQHQDSLTLPFSLVKQISPESWLVFSEKSISSDITNSQTYIVKKQKECVVNCPVKCQYCSICLHTFTCNCHKAKMANNICKHIHLINRFINESNIVENLNINLDDITVYQHEINSNFQNLPEQYDSNFGIQNAVFIINSIESQHENDDSNKDEYYDENFSLNSVHQKQDEISTVSESLNIPLNLNDLQGKDFLNENNSYSRNCDETIF